MGGGGNQFLKALREELISLKVYTDNPKKADAIIFNSHHNIEDIYRLRKKYPWILFFHRLDGPVQIARGLNDGIDAKIFEANAKIASGTIFQSKWSKKASETLGFYVKNSAIITNAPDSAIFTRGEQKYKKFQKIKIIATSWSGNIRKGFDVYKWLDENLNFNKYQMTFIGNSPVKFRNIEYKKPINSFELASELRQHHVYITASKFESCSNALLEAIHCGLPAIAYNSTGNTELVKYNGEVFTRNEEIIEKLKLIEENYELYRINKLPNIHEVALKYYNFILKTSSKVKTKLSFSMRIKRKFKMK